MIIRLTLVVGSLLFISCQPKKNTENLSVEKKPDSAFAAFLTAIPPLELPYSTVCDRTYSSIPNVDEKLTKQFSPEDLIPYRKISSDKAFEVIVFLASGDISLPVICSYNKQGKIIASQPLFFNYCGGEPGLFRLEYITIHQNLVISHVDSIWTHQLNRRQKEIKETEDLTVKYSSFEFLEDGQIIKKNSD